MSIYGYEGSRKIYEILGESELLAQLAEEAAELAQAALKLRRALDGTNPTPKSVSECRDALKEEYTDVIDCGMILMLTPNPQQISFKRTRWMTRLRDKDDGGYNDGQTQS